VLLDLSLNTGGELGTNGSRNFGELWEGRSYGMRKRLESGTQ